MVKPLFNKFVDKARPTAIKSASMKGKSENRALYQRVRDILESAHTGVVRTVNTTQVIANWLIGREIVEEQQHGARRAGYGDRLVHDLATKLHQDYGPGYGLVNLKLFRQFYLAFPELVGLQKGCALRNLFQADVPAGDAEIFEALRQISDAPLRKLKKSYAVRSQSEPT